MKKIIFAYFFLFTNSYPMLKVPLQERFPRTYTYFSNLFPRKPVPQFPTRLEMYMRHANAGNNDRAFTELLAAMCVYPKAPLVEAIENERKILIQKKDFLDLSLTYIKFFYTDVPDDLVNKQVRYAARKGDLSAQQLGEFLGLTDR